MSLSRLSEGFPAASRVLFSLFLLLQGCTGASRSADQSALPATPPAEAIAATSPLVAWVASQPSDRYADTILDDPDFGKNVSVRTDSHYLSALGVPCRRARINVVVNGPPAETIAVCQHEDGRWFLAPRIWKGAVAGNNR